MAGDEDKKSMVISTALTTFVAVAVTGAVGWATGVWNQGNEAIVRDQIEEIVKEILEEEMKTDSGMTQAEALVMVNATLVRIETTTNLNRDDIKDLRTAIRALAGE